MAGSLPDTPGVVAPEAAVPTASRPAPRKPKPAKPAAAAVPPAEAPPGKPAVAPAEADAQPKVEAQASPEAAADGAPPDGSPGDPSGATKAAPRKVPAVKPAAARRTKPTDTPAPKAGLFEAVPDDGTGVGGYRTDLDRMKPMEIRVAPAQGLPTTLAQAVRTAISDNALIKVSEGNALDALAAIDQAAAALYPQVEGRVAVGASGTGDWEAALNKPYFNRKNAYGAARGDVSLSGQQTLFDFGATRATIARAAAQTEAQNYSVLQTIEDVAYRTADAYLKVLQERELVDLASDNVASLKEIADLVLENQRNGNGTVADVKRVNARVIDAASSLADEQLALKLVSDQLRRLIRVDPGRLGPAPSLAGVLPPDEAKALVVAVATNPGILAYKASVQSRENEIASIRKSQLPKVTAEISAYNKQYQAVKDKTQLDGSAMLGVTYKFYDGGFAAAQIEQVRARMLQDEMRMRDARETIESDLRQNYFTIKVARDKNRSLAEGVDLNSKARTLYREQFRGGKRTLLELLEVQQAYFLARRAQITNQFDERRAGYQVLRALGRFAVAALRTR